MFTNTLRHAKAAQGGLQIRQGSCFRRRVFYIYDLNRLACVIIFNMLNYLLFIQNIFLNYTL